MDRCLIMTWSYTYDKESTWFDYDSGEEQYELKEEASYPLPHIREKSLEIHSLTAEGDLIKAEIFVDSATYTVLSDGEPVKACANDSYSVAGDSVWKTLDLTLAIR